MEKIINFRSGLLTFKVLKMMALFVAVLFNSCQEDEALIELTIPSRISFTNDSYKMERNPAAGLPVTFKLTRPLEEKGTIVIKIGDNSTASESEYSISPAPVSGVITLELEKGATEASILVTSAKNFDDDKTLVLSLVSTSGGVVLHTQTANPKPATAPTLSAVVTMTGNRIRVPKIESSLTNLESFGEVKKGDPPVSKSFTIRGTDLSENVKVEASENFVVSLDDVTFGPSVTVPYQSLNAEAVPIFVQFVPNTGTDQDLTGTITSSSTETSNVVNVSGTETGNTVPPEVMIFEENFDYGTTAGNLTTMQNGNWAASSGAGMTPVKYVVSGLSFTGYPGSAKGGAAAMENGSGSREDVFKSFTSQNSGVIYIAQMVNVGRSTTGDFFYSMREGNDFFNRLYAKDDGSGKLILSLGRNTVSVSSPTPYEYNKTYLIVIKYDFSSKVSSMYVIDGTIPNTEPATADAVSSAGTAPTTLSQVAIRQNMGVLDATIDGIRLGKTWAGVVQGK